MYRMRINTTTLIVDNYIGMFFFSSKTIKTNRFVERMVPLILVSSSVKPKSMIYHFLVNLSCSYGFTASLFPCKSFVPEYTYSACVLYDLIKTINYFL